MSDALKRVWVNPDVEYADREKQYGCDIEYHRADLSADLVRAALYKTRGYTWSGVEALIADSEAVAAIVAQVMEKE